MPEKLRVALIITISGVWLVQVGILPVVIPEFHPAPEISAAFMTIVGLLAVAGRSKKEKEEEDKDDDNDRQPS